MSASGMSPGPECILVAEDSIPNRTILTLLLKKFGFEVIEADDGAQAWDILQRNEESNIIGIMSDMMMPNMDGLELLRRVRNEDKFSRLPFILITAVTDKDYIFEAKSLNAQGYILKPVTYVRVLAKLRETYPSHVFPQVEG